MTLDGDDGVSDSDVPDLTSDDDAVTALAIYVLS